jgi:hypothetical protein
MIGRRSHDAQSFEEAWSGRAPRDEHIADLVRFVEGVCAAAAVVEPSTQFRDSLRTQLMVEAETALVPMPATTRTEPAAPAHRPGRARRRVAGLTAAMVASGGVIGLVSSSASAVPGEMLYPVKRGVESVELALHRDDASRGSFQLAQASERLAEAQRLSSKDGSERLIADTLDDFATQAESGSTSLFSDFSDSGETKSIRTVNDFAADASADLSTLSPQLPSGADDAFAAATEAVSDLATQASSLCVSCTTADVQQLVAAVTGLAKAPHAAPKASSSSDTKKSTAGTGSTTDSTPAGKPAPTQKPIVAAPATPATTKAPSLSDVTDPVLGGLLGDEKQEGLVPGLLNGLLGKK